MVSLSKCLPKPLLFLLLSHLTVNDAYLHPIGRRLSPFYPEKLSGNHGKLSRGGDFVSSLDASMVPLIIPLDLLPSASSMFLSSLFPTLLGCWRFGYSVSYGYGGAMLASGVQTLRKTLPLGQSGFIASLHASALVFYGVRLCAFLLHRQITTPEEIHQMKPKEASLVDRLKRIPVLITISLLYFLMAAPLRITAGIALSTPSSSLNPLSLSSALLAFAGFGLAAWGDFHKSSVKSRKGADHLVTTGPYRWLRHPNYTGEMIGWTASLAVAFFELVGIRQLGALLPWAVASVLGWAGIIFQVLMKEATGGLERKHQKKYGGRKDYEEWKKRTWSGPMF